MDVFTAMQQRRSTRVYLDKPVARAEIEEIFKYASQAPSAINLQPWEYVVVYGQEKDRLVRRLLKAHAERQIPCGPGTSTRPPEIFTRRSRQASDVMAPPVATTGQTLNRFVEEGSCSFYGAPIAIIVTIDRLFPKLRYLDLGLSISYLLLAAEARGIGTCPIGLITAYATDIADFLSIPDNKEIVLGIALGYADESSPINNFKTARAVQTEILTWYE